MPDETRVLIGGRKLRYTKLYVENEDINKPALKHRRRVVYSTPVSKGPQDAYNGQISYSRLMYADTPSPVSYRMRGSDSGYCGFNDSERKCNSSRHTSEKFWNSFSSPVFNMSRNLLGNRQSFLDDHYRHSYQKSVRTEQVLTCLLFVAVLSCAGIAVVLRLIHATQENHSVVAKDDLLSSNNVEDVVDVSLKSSIVEDQENGIQDRIIEGSKLELYVQDLDKLLSVLDDDGQFGNVEGEKMLDQISPTDGLDSFGEDESSNSDSDIPNVSTRALSRKKTKARNPLLKGSLFKKMTKAKRKVNLSEKVDVDYPDLPTFRGGQNFEDVLI